MIRKIIFLLTYKMENIDIYLEIAKESDIRTILNMLSVNKKFNDDKIFKEILLRKYPKLVKYKKEENWKKYFLNIVYFISKLEEEFNYKFDNDKNPEKIYYWFKLLEKFDKWRSIEVDFFQLYNSMNIYDLLYNPIENGNHDTLSSYLINEKTKMNTDIKYEYFKQLHELTPESIFGEESLLFELTEDIEPNDNLTEFSEYISYDYEYLIYILNKNGKTIEEYEKLLEEHGKSINDIKEYPKLYIQKLSENPAMHNINFLHEKIRNKTNQLIDNLLDETENEYTKEDLILTDDEIDLILDLQQKVMNFENGLTILTEVKAENFG